MATFSQLELKREMLPSEGQDGGQRFFTKLFKFFAGYGLLFGLVFFLSTPARAQKPLGTDVSGYQTSINWTTVKNAGVAFAWTKATEGTYYTSGYFAGQESGAKAVGIYVGAYHYARPSADPGTAGADAEAQYFWNVAGNYIKAGGSYCVPMLDWEDVSATNQFTAAQMSAWVNEWCLSVSNHAAAAGVVGVRPVVYTGTWYSQPSGIYSGLDSSVTSWPNWMSDYNGQNAQTGSPAGHTYPWPSWNIWQYSDTNWSGGDADVYNGNLSGFIQTFVIGGTNSPLLTTPPASITVGVGSNATFSVRASGQAPLAFQWYSGGQLIPGATSSNYTIANVQLTNAGGYSVSVSNSYAKISSSTVFLSALGPRTNVTGSAIGPANMASWWPAEGNGVDIYGGNNLTPNNGLYYTNGEVGMSFHFDGSSSYLTPTTTTTLATPWTLCVWVNRQNAPGNSAAIMGDSTYAVKLEQYNVTRQIGITKSGVADYVFHCSLPQNTWTHLGLVNSGSTISVYSNGVFVTSQLYSNGVVITPPSLPLPRGCIGGDLLANGNLTDPMLGRLDEVQIFSRALSSMEIASIYNAGSAGLINAPDVTSASSTNGQVQLKLIGLTGKNINILTSTDLVTWVSLGSVANSSGSTTYSGIATNSQQFYRVSQ